MRRNVDTFTHLLDGRIGRALAVVNADRPLGLAGKIAAPTCMRKLLLFNGKLTAGYKVANLNDFENRTQRSHAASGVQPVVAGREVENVVLAAAIGENDYVLRVLKPGNIVVASLGHRNNLRANGQRIPSGSLQRAASCFGRGGQAPCAA